MRGLKPQENQLQKRIFALLCAVYTTRQEKKTRRTIKQGIIKEGFFFQKIHKIDNKQ